MAKLVEGKQGQSGQDPVMQDCRTFSPASPSQSRHQPSARRHHAHGYAPAVQALLLLILVSMQAASAIDRDHYRLDSATIARVDSMFAADSSALWAGVIDTDPAIYFGATFKTLSTPFEMLVDAFNAYHVFSSSVSFIKRFERLWGHESLSPHGSFYLEAGNPLVKDWVILDLDTIHRDSVSFRAEYRQNKTPSLNERWRGHQSALFVVENEDFNVVWHLRKLGAGRTRTGVVLWIDPDMYIPRWMYRLVAEHYLPKFLGELEQALERHDASEMHDNEE
jgi:hypothetical protein